MIEYKDKIDFASCVRMVTDLFDIDYYHEYAQVLYAQAQLETGKFNSNIYKNGNNLFGMKPSKKRKKYWQVNYSSHAKYAHRFISIMDRIDWDIWHGCRFSGDVNKYMGCVYRNKYAEDKEYLNKWKQLYNNL